jgi:hypothetical protein
MGHETKKNDVKKVLQANKMQRRHFLKQKDKKLCGLNALNNMLTALGKHSPDAFTLNDMMDAISCCTATGSLGYRCHGTEDGMLSLHALLQMLAKKKHEVKKVTMPTTKATFTYKINAEYLEEQVRKYPGDVFLLYIWNAANLKEEGHYMCIRDNRVICDSSKVGKPIRDKPATTKNIKNYMAKNYGLMAYRVSPKREESKMTGKIQRSIANTPKEQSLDGFEKRLIKKSRQGNKKINKIKITQVKYGNTITNK